MGDFLDDLHQKILEARIKESNREWLVKRLCLGVIAAVIIFCGLLSMCSPSEPEKYSSSKTREQKTSVEIQAENNTKTAICDYFENRNIKIKRAMYQPLVEKDPGLYGGKERWWVTFENGDYTAVWVKDGKMTFFYNGTHYDDVPLY